jgi:uncharacterized damage-inducible protein DinB
MTSDHFQVLARYNRWMNEKFYAVAAELTDEERKQDRGAFFKSIHATLNHILLADRVWMGRFTGAVLEDGWMGPGGIRSLDQELYSDFEQLRRERTKTDDESRRGSRRSPPTGSPRTCAIYARTSRMNFPSGGRSHTRSITRLITVDR